MNKMLLLYLILLTGTITFAFPKTMQLVGTTTRISIGNDGQQGNYNSEDSAISDDGRYIVFESLANNLVPGDYNEFYDVFLYDDNSGLLRGITTSGNWGGLNPAISADGRYIVFESHSTNLVVNDNNDETDIFLYDQQTGFYELVSVNSEEEQANYSSFSNMDISPDGRFVAFSSGATNLDERDNNFDRDVYVRDRLLGVTEWISFGVDGSPSNSGSGAPVISADGRYVAFVSAATNLVANDTNDRVDIFFHDRQTGITHRLSESESGQEGNHESSYPSISDDGRFIVFLSFANNLVANDTNGSDVFIRDTWLGTIQKPCDSVEGNGDSNLPFISGNGKFIVFISAADNLVAGDSNQAADAFVCVREQGLIERVSLANNGDQANATTWEGVISVDGRMVAFASGADNLVVGDTNEWIDIFLREMAWPAVTISQTVGAVGSYFGLIASHFPPTSTLSVIVNGNLLGTLPTDSQGQVALELDTATADPGFYQVRLAVDPYWQEVSFTLTETGVVYPSLGRGVVVVPAGIPHHRAFLPLLFLPPNP